MRTFATVTLVLLTATAVAGPTVPDSAAVYVVATSHLDTQWRWTIQETIRPYLLDTLEENLAWLEKYPDYVFNFEGAFRYQLMQEYYPELYAEMKDRVAEGRWRVCGSWLDAVDTNMPSPESLIRHVLYGNGWFRREFGTSSVDVFLPDCFGFGYALPSIMVHCGLTGFSTQKLTWGSAYGIPFDLGVWRGVDGSEVVAAVNPGAYVNDLETDLSRDSTVVAAIERTVAAGGPPVAFKYYGTGDTGGGPTEESVQWLERSLASDGPVRVISAGADQIYRDLTPEQIAALPRYDGELVMTSHGAGCYTSQAAMKRWNRRCEVLGDAAERAATVAWWLGGKEYPHLELERAWTRFLWHQFHDDLTGTSIPEAYTFSWNDLLLSQAEFAQILTDAVGTVARALDTNVEGRPVVVFNPLGFERTDLVMVISDGPYQVLGPDGREVPAQYDPDAKAVRFLATVPSVGFAVYDLRRQSPPKQPVPSEISWDPDQGLLENHRYSLRLTENGLVSLFDKQAGRELLAAPPRLQLLHDEPLNWAAWEVDFDDVMADPYAEVPLGGVPETVTIGPACAQLTFSHKAAGSVFKQVLTLGAGAAADRLTWDLTIDWATEATLLKAAFFTTARDTQATYDLGLGAIRRGLNREKLYEVPAQRWADVTDASGAFGLTVMNDGRHGWDLPEPGVLRLSVIHTPAVNDRWRWIDDQKSQDLGRHRLTIALAGHGPDWRTEAVRQADRLNQPPLAFATDDRHSGSLGRKLSWLQVSDPRVAVRAVKKAEDTDRLIVRLQETSGEALPSIELVPLAPAQLVIEVRGDEVQRESGHEVRLRDGMVACDLAPYQPRTFALELTAAPRNLRVRHPQATPVDLPWNLDGISTHEDPTDGDVAGVGWSLPSEVIPATIVRDGIPFRTGPRGHGQANLVQCRGQEIALPARDGGRLVLLACGAGASPEVRFTVGSKDAAVTIPDGTDFFGQWDSRVQGPEIHHASAELTPGYVQHLAPGWVATHRHDAAGQNEPYVFIHFYRVPLEIPAGVTAVRLPDDPRVVVLAATLVEAAPQVVAAGEPLVDRPDRPSLRFSASRRAFVDTLAVTLSCPAPGATIRYRLGSGPVQQVDRRAPAPIVLTASTSLRATAFAPGFAEPVERTLTFTRHEPWPTDSETPVGDLPEGLRVRGYDGAWEKLPDFTTLEPTAIFAGEPVAIPDPMREEDIGLVFEGWLVAPERGMYRLYLASDDGSKLWLDGEEMVDHDGLHGQSEMWADAPLEAGPHRLRVAFFQHLGGRGLSLKWSGPGIDKQVVPLTALRHVR